MASSLSLLTREIEDLLIAYVSLFIFCDHKGKTRNKSCDFIKTMKTLSLSDIENIGEEKNILLALPLNKAHNLFLLLPEPQHPQDLLQG